jgi:anti-sigma regulatory factor (Ser/Thr protein kinase)
MDAATSGFAGTGPVGLLTASEPADDRFEAASWPESAVGTGTAAVRGAAAVLGLEQALGPVGALAALGPAGASPCGTGWPSRSARGTGWPLGPPLGAGSGAPAGRGSRHEVSCALAGQLGSVPLARDFARSAVHRWGLPELCDDVMSVVSELVTNALRYGLDAPGSVVPGPAPSGPEAGIREASGSGWPTAPIELRLRLRQADVICMVADPGTGIPVRSEPGGYSESGRGLHVVESCSDQWGWDPLAGGGKIVWAAFRV